MKTVNIAMIQMLVRESQPQENLAHADQLLSRTCGNHSVDIAVLPECMDLGWSNPIALREAQSIPCPVSTGKGADRKAIGNSIAYGAGGILLAELPFGENAEAA